MHPTVLAANPVHPHMSIPLEGWELLGEALTTPSIGMEIGTRGNKELAWIGDAALGFLVRAVCYNTKLIITVIFVLIPCLAFW